MVILSEGIKWQKAKQDLLMAPMAGWFARALSLFCKESATLLLSE